MPGYLSVVTGVSVDELERAPVRRVLLPSLLFVLTFSTIFVLLGVTATRVGGLLTDNVAGRWWPALPSRSPGRPASGPRSAQS